MSPILREELITVENEGARLYGMLHLPVDVSGPAPAVVLLHGFTGSSTSDNRILVRQSRLLARAGIAALRFDFRGSGQSEGEFSDVTLSGEISDALQMCDFLAGNPAIDPERLGVLGLSLGAAVAACVIGRNEHIRAAVLWAPVAYPDELLRRVAAASGIAPDSQSGQADAFGELVGPAFIMELPLIAPIDAVAGSTVPLLVVHGTADTTVPIGEGRAYCDAVSGPKQLTPIAGANHTFQAVPWRTTLFTETSAWFARYL